MSRGLIPDDRQPANDDLAAGRAALLAIRNEIALSMDRMSLAIDVFENERLRLSRINHRIGKAIEMTEGDAHDPA